MTTQSTSESQRYKILENNQEILAVLQALLKEAKEIAYKTGALQQKSWPNELREVANEICKVSNIPQLGVGYLYASFFTIYDSFLRENLSEDQILHFLLITPEEMNWFEKNRMLTGKPVFELEQAEMKRIALCLVNKSHHHNSKTGFLDWNRDTPLDALEAEKFLAYQGF